MLCYYHQSIFTYNGELLCFCKLWTSALHLHSERVLFYHAAMVAPNRQTSKDSLLHRAFSEESTETAISNEKEEIDAETF